MVAEWGNGEIRDWRERGGREMSGRVVGVRGVGGGREDSWHLDRKGIDEWVYACRASVCVRVCGG